MEDMLTLTSDILKLEDLFTSLEFSIGLTFYDIIWTSILSSSEPWSLKTAALTFIGEEIFFGAQF